MCNVCHGSGRMQHIALGAGGVGGDFHGGDGVPADGQVPFHHHHHHHDGRGPCPVCGGRGWHPHHMIARVYVPPGSYDGEKLLISGTANAYAVLRLQPHEDFRIVNQHDLEINIDVLPMNVEKNRISVHIEHLDKHDVHVVVDDLRGELKDQQQLEEKVNPLELTVRVAGQGMPVHGRPWEHGDLFVRFVFSDEVAALLRPRLDAAAVPASTPNILFEIKEFEASAQLHHDLLCGRRDVWEEEEEEEAQNHGRLLQAGQAASWNEWRYILCG